MSDSLFVDLVNFRCHEKLHIEFKKGLTLVTGKSGSGKTTLLESIQWCMYGNIRNISDNKKRTIVVITIGGVVLTRKTKPNMFEVNVEGRIHKGDVATKYVYSKYGSPKVWESCSYIKQKNRCKFLSESNNSKVDILIEMLFSEDPFKYIKKVKTKISEINRYVVTKQNDLASKNELISYMKSKCDTSKVRDMKDLENDKIKLSDAANKAKIKLRLHKNNKVRYSVLLEELKTKNAFVKSKEGLSTESEIEVLISTIFDIKSRRKHAVENNKLVRERNKLKEKLPELSKMYGTPKKHSFDFLCDAKALSRKFERNKNLCVSLGIIYDAVSISSALILEENKIIKFRDILELVIESSKKKEILNKINKLGNFHYVSNEDYKAGIENHKNTVNGLNVLRCPHCSDSVCYSKGKLIKSSLNMTTAADVKRSKRNLDDMKSNNKKSNVLDVLTLEMKSLKNVKEDYGTLSIGDIESKIKKSLKRAKIIESIAVVPYSDYMRYFKQNEAYNMSVRLMSMSCGDEIVDSVRLSSNLRKSEKLLVEKRNINTKLTLYKKRINKIGLELSKLYTDESIQSRLDVINRKLSFVKSEIVRSSSVKEIHNLERSILKRKKLIDSQNNDIDVLNKHLVRCLSVSDSMLENSISRINGKMQFYLSKTFRDPISAKINIYKKLKNGKSKHSVNFIIGYRGRIYDKISQMSGGEGDRVSVALTLSFCEIYDSGFILFDETTPSLDSYNRRKSKKILNDKSKYIICVGHNEIEGEYDHVVNL